jgi:hypothetical protein
MKRSDILVIGVGVLAARIAIGDIAARGRGAEREADRRDGDRSKPAIDIGIGVAG